ncbi:MAG: MFS transporter [Acetobacterales bacterium]
MSERNGARLSWTTLLFYGLPGFALAMPTIPVYVYLPSFYADSVGLGLTATGAVLLFSRVLDVVTDPLVGTASDRLRVPGGRRKPWMVAGAIIAAVALVRLFQPPAEPDAWYLLLWSAVLYLGWTLLAVPYTALGAELSSDYHQRTRITGFREGALLGGILAAGSIPALATGFGASEAQSLAIVAWLAIGAGAPAIALLCWRVAEPPRRAALAAAAGGWRAYRDVLHNGPFMRLLAAWFANGLANGLPAVLFPLYLEHGLQADSTQRGILIFLYFVCGVLAIPFWVRLSARYGKHRIWSAAMVAACAAFVWVPALGPGDVWAFGAICVVTGMALGADLALPPALQADVVDYDTLRTGEHRAGLFFALWSMATKLALACAVGFAFPVLDLVGFDTGGGNSADALLALALIYAALPVVLKIGAIATIWGHPITEQRHAEIRAGLAARSVSAGSAGA